MGSWKAIKPELQDQQIQKEPEPQNDSFEQIDYQEKDPLEIYKELKSSVVFNNDLVQQQFSVRRQRIKAEVEKVHGQLVQFPTKPLIVPDMTVREVYNLIYSNQEYINQANKQTYRNFIEFYMIEQLREENIKITQIDPAEPDYFGDIYSENLLQLIDYADFSQRMIECTHPIKKSIFMPSQCQCVIQEKFYWLGQDEIIIERNLSLRGIPMGECFDVVAMQYIEQQGNDVKWSNGYYIKFKKSTWFKGMIESSAKEENEKSLEGFI